MSKLVGSIKEAIVKSGLKSGMCISFHHHLRGGDYVLNMVMDEIAGLGIKGLTINASSIHDGHAPLIKHMADGVVAGLETNYIGPVVGKAISEGGLAKPVLFRTHGGRASDLETGRCKIDVAFIAAPASDCMGNCSGKIGKSACGSLGYAFSDAMYADKVIVITDDLQEYPFTGFSIPENTVDFVVCVDAIGDPGGIVSGTTRVTKSPVSLKIADYAARAIDASGYLKDGFSFQTGAGGASLATAVFLKKIMQKKQVTGSYALGGITGYLVDMFHAGCFRALQDVQCFDLQAVESLRNDPGHMEISASQYAGPASKSSAVSSLDVAVLGATEIDVDFNVNVHTDSNGYIMGGSGGHSDAAQECKMTVIVAPLTRKRYSVVVDRVTCISTPGSTVDVLITQYGAAVNPRRPELLERFQRYGIPVADIHALKEQADRLNGIPEPLCRDGKRVVANVQYRDGRIIDRIYQV